MLQEFKEKGYLFKEKTVGFVIFRRGFYRTFGEGGMRERERVG